MSEIKITALTENLDRVIGFIEDELDAMDCPAKTRVQINVAVEEIFVNIAHYAYADGCGDATINICNDSEAQAIRIKFMDSGVPYNPLEKPDPDVTLSAEEREIGGLGIYMVKKSMDEINYEYKDGKNILEIVKKK